MDLKDIRISIIGLGYVGLPLAVLFSKKYKVLGYDIDKNKINQYKKGIDITAELKKDDLKKTDITFTTDEKKIKDTNFIIITVPTPIDNNKQPNLNYIRSATKTVAKNLKKNSIIIYESTVFPGVTEEICIPLIENYSGLTSVKDFKVGYSPERLSPGDKNKRIENIIKLVSGIDSETVEIISEVYSSVLNKGVFKTNSIKVAEAAKITENIQRDVNIALMNELSIIFNYMNIDTSEVLEAASTKWNFNKYQPGLVGGHCIGIDPYYLIYKSKKLNYSPRLIQTSRIVNEDLVNHIIKNILFTLINNDIKIKNSKIIVFGITFKENCNDIRNSKIIDIIYELKTLGVNIIIYDPYVNADELYDKFALHTTDNYIGKYDAIIMGVAHSCFNEFKLEDIKKISKDKPILFDLKSQLKKFKMKDVIYWSL